MFLKEGLAFDDAMLIPKYSTVKSRSMVDLSVDCGKFKLSHPIVPANMHSIMSKEMATEVANSGGLTLLHRFMPIENQLNLAKDLVLNYGPEKIGVSVGIKENDRENFKRFLDIGINIFCTDIAHGDSQNCYDMISYMKSYFPHITIISGSIATGDGAIRSWRAGADIIKTNVGAGSICTTRIMTGNGVPQLTALIDVAHAKNSMINRQKESSDPILSRKKYLIMSDGGATCFGDLTKALCFADIVMTGNLFAGCKETPGNILNIDGLQYKEYVGSSTHKSSHIEGVSAVVQVKDNYNLILKSMLEAISSGCSYQGAHNLTQLKNDPHFVKISSAGLRESHHHDVKIL